jgi:hypothetical protein
MIVKDTLPATPGSPLNQKYLDLSNEEFEEVKQIMERLRVIFEAQSISMRQTEYSITDHSCFVIEIYNSPLGKKL